MKPSAGGYIPAAGLNIIDELANVSFVVGAGAAGWVETDISTAITGEARFSIWMVFPAGNQNAGVRNIDSAIDTKHGNGAGINALAGICAVKDGKVDFYRDAANNTYYCVGYIR